MAIAEQSTTSNTGIGIASGENATQSFTVNGVEDILCNYVKLRFGRQATTTSGSVRLGIYADDGSDNPTGPELVGVTVSYSDLAENSWDYNFGWHTFTFASPITLTAGVKYVLKITSTMDNYARWRIATSNTYADGLAKLNGVGWGGAGYDFTFQVYKADTIENDITADATLAKGIHADATLQGTLEDDITADATLAGLGSDDITVDATLKYPDDNTRHKLTLTFNDSTPLTGTRIDGARSIARNSRIARVYLILENTGSSGTTTIDVNVDGVSVFTNPANRPSIVAGGAALVYSLPTTRNISANSQITMDIDSLATDAAGLSVIVELNVATTYTHVVRKVNVLDNSILVNNREGIGYLTSTLQLQIIFDEPMDESIEPTIVLTPVSMLDTLSVSAGGTWSSTFEKYDTYTTPIMDASSSDFNGVSEIAVSDAENVFGETVDNYYTQLELSNGLLVEFEDTYIKTADNNILINSDTIKRFKYSFDNVTFSSWQDYAESTTVDVTDAGVGGDGSQGEKTCYLLLEDVRGNTASKEINCYYITSISQVSNFSIQAAGKENYWVLRWDMPTETNEAKIDRFKIYVDDVLYTTVYNPYPSYLSGLALDVPSIVEDKTTDTITYPMASGIVFDSEGNQVNVSSANLDVDFATDNDRYDIIGIDKDGNYKVISGVEGVEFRPTYPFETINEVTGDIEAPIVPNLEIGFLPLYYCRVRTYDWTSSTGTEGKDCLVDVRWIFDVRESKRKALLYLEKDEDDHIIKVQAVTLSGLTSDYDYTFSSISYPVVKYNKLQAWSAKDGGGVEVVNGGFIQENDGTLTNNLMYYKFVEEEE